MKTIQTIAFTMMLAAATTTVSYAQSAHGHEHKSPRGGVVQDANGYHVEMVKTKDTLNFYLTGADNKPVGKPVKGKVTFEFANSTKSSSSLILGKNGALQVALPKANIFEFCNVTLEFDNKSITTKFKNSVSDSDKAHGHQH